MSGISYLESACQNVRKYDPLILTVLKYFCINNGDQGFSEFEIIINGLVISFEDLYYGTTAMINIFTHTEQGAILDVRT